MTYKKRRIFGLIFSEDKEKILNLILSGKLTKEEARCCRFKLNYYYCGMRAGQPIIFGFRSQHRSDTDDGVENHIYIGRYNCGRYPVSLDTFEPETNVRLEDAYWVKKDCAGLREYAEKLRRLQ